MRFLRTIGLHLINAALLGTVVATAGCMMDDDDAPGDPAGNGSGAGGPGAGGSGAGGGSATSDEDEYNARARGAWLLQFTVPNPAGSVYVDDYQTFYADENRFTLLVEVFLDEARKAAPFLTYEAEFRYEVVGRSETVPDGFELDVRNERATMTALVDDPPLFAALGLDDCGVQFNQPVDVSQSGCGAPSFRDGSCVEKDLYQIAQGAEEMFPAAGSGDRCVTRPAGVDPTLVYKLLRRRVP